LVYDGLGERQQALRYYHQALPIQEEVGDRAGEAARLGFPVHPHMLRHATGFKLASAGHDTRVMQHYLGHKNIQHTVGYTVLAAARFQGLWPD
jgi:site-specific recombinase XerD